jgi:hypothetical protein
MPEIDETKKEKPCTSVRDQEHRQRELERYHEKLRAPWARVWIDGRLTEERYDDERF